MVKSLMISGGDGAEASAISINSEALPEPPLFMALMVTVALPAVLGVPLINPLVALSDNPPGRVPETE